jgi:2-dehydropantoate 2-reductase
MKVCIFGAGTLGGHLAARFISANNADLSLVGRGAQLAAIRNNGISLTTGGRTYGGKAAVATDDPASLPQQDIVFVALKGQMLPAAAAAIGKLVKPDGCAVFLLNGIPWWFNHELPGDDKKGTLPENTGNKGTLPLLDPHGALWREVRPERVIGGVAYSPNTLTSPGVIKHAGHNRWIFGEPDNSMSARLKTVVDVVGGTGIEAVASTDIRREIFRKMSANASNNSLGALTRLDTAAIAEDDALAALATGIVSETLAVAARLGCDLSNEINPTEVARRSVGKPGQKPSTVQDAMAGRSLEIDGLIGQTQAFARELGVATPVIDVCYALLRGLDASFRK